LVFDTTVLENAYLDPTDITLFNITAVSGSQTTLYISGRFYRTLDAKYCAGVYKYGTSQGVAGFIGTSDTTCYAGRMAHDGTYLHVIGKQDSSTYFYRKLNSSMGTEGSQIFGSTALKDISCYGSGAIRILASNGTVYDENKTTYGTVSGATGIKMINAATWVIGTTSGYSYTGNNGGSYTVFPVSGGTITATDIGDYVN
jgi:hypothetical protein